MTSHEGASRKQATVRVTNKDRRIAEANTIIDGFASGMSRDEQVRYTASLVARIRQEAKLAERETCAKVCEGLRDYYVREANTTRESKQHNYRALQKTFALNDAAIAIRRRPCSRLR